MIGWGALAAVVCSASAGGAHGWRVHARGQLAKEGGVCCTAVLLVCAATERRDVGNWLSCPVSHMRSSSMSDIRP